MRNVPWIAFAILAYCVWNSQELVEAWSSAPLEQYGWVLFLIWLSPALVQWKKIQSSVNTYLLGAALASSSFGVLASVNAASYYGMAIAIASAMPWSLLSFGWLISALGWMPAAGWLGSRLFHHAGFEIIFLTRLLIVCMGSYCAWRLVK
jgi:hypothetical protein